MKTVVKSIRVTAEFWALIEAWGRTRGLSPSGAVIRAAEHGMAEGVRARVGRGDFSDYSSDPAGPQGHVASVTVSGPIPPMDPRTREALVRVTRAAVAVESKTGGFRVPFFGDVKRGPMQKGKPK